MAGITHDKVLTGSDGTNPNRAQPSDWNADHVLPDPLDLTGDLNVDTIDESTTDAGVTIEGVLLKDSGIVFSDPLTEFDVGEWSPSLTFASPGDLSVAYITQVGAYTRIGDLVHVRAEIVTSAFTHSTASGALRCTGLPFTVGSVADGALVASGWTSAGLKWINARAQPTATFIYFPYSISGAAISATTTTQWPTGASVVIYLSLTYEV
jgi:hypothetical protein